MRVAMIGSGYVGLVSAACLADFGNSVVCVDTNAAKIAALKAGHVPIFEPGLAELIDRNVKGGRLSFTDEAPLAVTGADVVFIAVGTAPREDGSADLAAVEAAACSIAVALAGFTIIVVKSTVPVGTGDWIEQLIRARNPEADFCVVSNPEFLREGSAIEDFLRPDRVVIGLEDPRGRDIMAETYGPLFRGETPFVFTGRRNSELIKYAANAFLAMKIVYINEIADLCERVGGDVGEIARGIGLDSRIGSRFLAAGPGFGGSCFPKDTSALCEVSRAYGAPLSLVEAAMASNARRKVAMADRIIEHCDGVRGKKIAVLGLAFKADTDDMREAPALTIIERLKQAGARVAAYDPVAMDGARKIIEGIDFASSAYDAAAGAHATVIVTEWKEFGLLNLQSLRDVMAGDALVDLRNVLVASEAARCGFRYCGIGSPPINPGQAFSQAAE